MAQLTATVRAGSTSSASSRRMRLVGTRMSCRGADPLRQLRAATAVTEGRCAWRQSTRVVAQVLQCGRCACHRAASRFVHHRKNHLSEVQIAPQTFVEKAKHLRTYSSLLFPIEKPSKHSKCSRLIAAEMCEARPVVLHAGVLYEDSVKFLKHGNAKDAQQ